MKTNLLFCLLLTMVANNSQSQTPCTPPAAPVVTSPLTYCQNATAAQLTATGTSLLWGGYSGSVGGVSNLTTAVYIDASYNNKKTVFSTSVANVTIDSVNFYVPSWQAVNGLVLSVYNNAGTIIATSGTTTSLTAGATIVKITSIFNYTIAAPGTYSIGISAGYGNIGSDNPGFPITETTGTLNITGVSVAGNRCFNNIQFSVSGSSTAPTPSTTTAGTFNYFVTQTIAGCKSLPATIAVIVNPSPAISQMPLTNLISNHKLTGNANDYTGNNNGTLQNSPATTTDRFNLSNSAYSFNGSTQYISTANQYVNPTNFTISIWFKTNTNTGGKLLGFGVSQTGESWQYDRHIYMNNSGQIYFGVYPGTVKTVNSALSYNDNLWHLATATLSSTNGMVLYIDGAAVANDPSTTIAELTTGYWRIGYDNVNSWTSQPSSHYFTGSLDDVLIYHSALSASDIMKLYTSPDGAGNNGPVCAGSSVILSASTVAGATYAWTGPNSFSSSLQNPTFTYSTVNNGVYKLQVTAGGCTSTAYTTLTGTSNTGQWTGNISTDWTNTGNWCTGVVPTSTTNVVIASTATRMPLISGTAACNNLTMNAGATLTTDAAGTLSIAGTLQNLGTMINSGTTVFNGTAVQNFSGVSSFYNLTINNPSGIILSSSIAVNNNITFTAGSLKANNFDVTVSGNWTNNVTTGAFLSGTSTVTFNGAAAQSIAGTSATNFNTLIIASNATVTLGRYINIAGNLTVSSGTFDLAGLTANRLTNGGTLMVANNATLKIGGTNTFPSNYNTNTLVVASTVEYSGTNQTVSKQAYGNLTLSSSAAAAATKTFPGSSFTILGNLTSTLGTGTSVTFTAGSSITVNGIVSIGASTTFNGGSYTHTIGGNWVNSGTFNGNTGTIKFAGPGSSVGGAGTQNFNNLTVSASQVIFSNNSINLSGNLSTTSSGSFSQASGGTVTMTGSGKTITGSGISLDNLTVSGTVSTAISLNLTGNLSVSGTLTSTTGSISMSGATKTISGTGTKNFGTLSVTGSITTAVNFSISTALTVTGSLSASAGTVTFTGTSSLSGTANLFNGTINGTTLQLSASSILGIANTLSITAGSLNVSSSVPNSVNFNGTGAQNINAITYCHLVLSNGNTKTALGAITTNYDINIGSSTTFNPSSYTHSIYGNWINNGTFTAGSSTIQFMGAANATITGATSFNILTTNTTSTTTELVLNNSVSAVTVNMTKGIISTGSNALTITGTRTGNGYIYGNITRTHSFTTGVAYAFEGPDNTINFSAVSAVTSVTVSVSRVSPGDFPYGNSISRTYNIVVPAGTYTATLRLHYEDDELNGNIENAMGLWNYNGATWQLLGKIGNSSTSNYVEQSGLTNISNRWTCSINPTVVVWDGSESTDWNTPANWTIYAGAPSTPPSATDVVVLGGGPAINQPTISTAVNIKNLVFVANQAATLSLAGGGSLTSGDVQGFWTGNAIHTINAGNQVININGNLLMSDGVNGHSINMNVTTGTINVIGSVSQSGNAAINFSSTGSLNIHQNYDFISGTFTAGTGTVSYNGDENQHIAHVNYNNLTINKATGLAEIDSVVNIAGNLLISSGELDNYSTTNIAGNVTISSGAALHNNYMLHVGGNWNNFGDYVGLGAHVVFNGSGTQTITATTFNNLVIHKPLGTSAELTGNVVINGDLTITSGTFNIKSFDCNRSTQGGTITLADSATFIVGANNSPLNFSNGTLADSSTVIADGNAPQYIFGVDFGNLIFRNGGAKTLVSPITVKGNLTIETGASFDAGAETLVMEGNWINNGTFVPSTSTLIFKGATKNISGNNTFNRMSVYGSYTFLNNNTIDSLLIINPSGSISGGSTITTTMNGDLINKGTLYALGSTTFTGNVLQTLSLIDAVQTVAITVNFNGTISPVLNSTSAPQYGFLNINNTGGVNPSVGWTIAYGLTVGSGASFNGGNATHNILGYVTNNGSITSSGTLNFIPATAKTINLGNNFSSTGMVNFGGAGAITLAGNNLDSFTNVLFSNTNAAGVTATFGMNVSNNFTLNNTAVFNAGSYSHLVGGNFLNNGTINSGTSSFTLNGIDHQDIFTNSPFYNLIINNTGGYATLFSNATVNANLNFISGKIQTENFTLIQPSTGTVSGAAQSTGWVDGNLQKGIATGATVKAFEIGDSLIYSPASLVFDNVTSAGTLKLNTVPIDHPFFSSSSINTVKNLDRYWVLTNNGIAFTSYDASLKYAVSDIDAGSTPSLFGVGLYTGSTWLYPVTGLITDTSALITAVTSFGDLAIGEICNKNTTITYTASPYCAAFGTAAVTLTGTTGGTFTSDAGLSIDASTGLVTLGSSVAGIYKVNYSIAATGECPSYIASTYITITAVPTAEGSYTGSPYCTGTGTAYPSGSGTGGGLFSSTAGLVLDSTTGGINLNTSTPATYTVTYTIAASGGCTSFSWTTDVSIVAPGSWTGLVNSDWNNSGNWLCGGIPTAATNVNIAGGLDYYPVISSVIVMNDLIIQPGAGIIVNDGTLQIAGGINNLGVLDVANGTIEMMGTSAQTIPAEAFTNNAVKNLIINNNVTLSGIDTLKGTLTIGAGKTFTTNNNLILKSDSNGTARIASLPVNGSGVATAFITGNVNIERYIPMRKAWRLLSAPLQSAGGPTINAAWQDGLTTASANPNLYPGYGVHIIGGTVANGYDQALTSNPSIKVFHNPSGNFVALPATGTNTPISNYPGYFLYLRGDRGINLMMGNNAATTATTLRMKGKIKTGQQTTTVNATGYTVLGNPFPSAIDFGTITKTNVKNAFYLWDPKLSGAYGLGAYVSFIWNEGSQTYDNTSALSPVSQYIPSGEAIMIESNDGINPGSISIKESDKTASGSDAVFGRSNGLNQKMRVNLLAANANGSTLLIDGVLSTYDDDNLNSIDNADAKKLNSASENIGIKSNATMLAIERRKTIISTDTTFLNLYQMKIQNYQLVITAENLKLTNLTGMLKDSYASSNNNLPLDMNGTTVVNFSINSNPLSYAINRFSIVYKAVLVLPVTIKSVKAYRLQNNIAVEWTTDNEINIQQYVVERSADGRSFTKINTSVATANNGGSAAYRIIDTDPLKGNNYYRIRSVEIAGNHDYSKTVIVLMQDDNMVPSATVYPNPVTGKMILIRFTNIESGNYTLQLFNTKGQLIAHKTIQHNSNMETENFEINQKFADGNYELKISGNGINITVPMMKR